jgi:NAD(P)-dependent dehydrogenase (short-subunit alcohol dehydrogenase family)
VSDGKLQGKNVFITGGTSGIGRAAAVELARDGANITLLARDPSRAAETVQEVTAAGGAAPRVVEGDLASLDSVRQASETFLATGEPVDILLNNAGIVNNRRRVTVDGYEETLAVNHLAPFLLTGLLLPAMPAHAGARIVNVSSGAHAFCRGMQFDDLQSERRYRTFNVYGRSKLANILFTKELARRLESAGITVNALHPGAVATRLGSQNGGWFANSASRILMKFFLSPEQGAATSIYLCRSDDVAEASGGYYYKCREIRPRPWALDEAAALELWRLSEELVAFKYPQLEN